MVEEVFAHPLVEVMSGWDFIGGAWFGAPNGLVRKDGTKKPAYDQLMKMFKEDLTTKDYTVHMNSDGIAEVIGLKGQY